jgi:hypothetical protein
MARERKAKQIEVVLTLEDNVGAVMLRVKKTVSVRLSDDRKSETVLAQVLDALPAEVEL